MKDLRSRLKLRRSGSLAGALQMALYAHGRATVIEAILPGGVVAVDTRVERFDIELFPQERAAVACAVEKRRREYVTTRACAREALARLGLPAAAIVGGERGEPLWPPGVIGSITHCAGYRACALARAGGGLAGLGIDAEPDAPLPRGVIERVARVEERPALAELARALPAIYWERLLFSAKEATYKVWFPLARCWLGFEDASVEIDVVSSTPEASMGAFRVRLSRPWPPAAPALPRVLEGRWLAREGLLLAAIALAAPRHAG